MMLRKKLNRISPFKTGLFNQVFIAMLMIMVLTTIIMGTFSYMLFSKTFKEELSQARTNALQQTARSSDTVIRSIEETMIGMSLQTKFANDIRTLTNNSYKNVNVVTGTLQSLRNTSRYIYSVYLYIEGDRILTAKDGIWKIDDFYDRSFLTKLPEDENIVWLPTRFIKDNTGASESVITFLIKLPHDFDVNERYLIVNLSESDFAGAIRSAKPAAGEYTMIVNRDNLIVSGGEEAHRGLNYKTLFAKGYDVFAIPSAYNNWQYINVVPRGSNAYPIAQTALFTLALAAVWMLLGSILSRRLSTGIYKPYSEIVSELRKGISDLPEEGDEAGYLQKSIRSMAEQNMELSRRMTGTEQAVRKNFVRNLIVGTYMEEAEISAQRDSAGIMLMGNRFCVLLIALDHVAWFNSRFSYKDRNLWLFSIENIASELIGCGESTMFTKTDDDKLVFIVPCGEELTELAAETKQKVAELLELSVTVVVSNRFEGLHNANAAYEKCVELLRYRMLTGSGVLLEKDIQQWPMGENKTEPLLTTQKREMLLNCLRQGHLAEACAMVDKLVKLVHERQLVDLTHIHMTVYTILGDAQSLLLENGWQLDDVFGSDRVLYQELANKETIEEIGQWLKEVFAKMGVSLSEKKETKNRSVMESILAYMNEHYNEDIRLNTLADTVFFSPAYLSRLFRQETGKNFVEYLTDIRVEKSCEMLQDPELKIAEIAQKANFGTVNNFLRVFKKYKSMTPGQYRSMLAIKNMKHKQDEDEHEE